MRTATLDAENEALRSHVSQLQEQIALLCEDLQVDGALDVNFIQLPAALQCSLHPGLIVLPSAHSAVACMSRVWIQLPVAARSSLPSIMSLRELAKMASAARWRRSE